MPRQHAPRKKLTSTSISRRNFLKLAGALGVTAVTVSAAAVVNSLLNQPQPVSPGLEGEPTSDTHNEEPRFDIGPGDEIQVGKLNVTNITQSNLQMYPNRFPPEIAKTAGLPSTSEPINFKIGNWLDTDPSTPEKEIATTSFNPTTHKAISLVSLELIIERADSQKNVLNTSERYNRFVSMFLSQVMAVEIYNNVHSMQQVSPESQVAATDKTANELGVIYRDMMYKSTAQPFVVFTGK